MTAIATELDLSVLTELDFPVPCAIDGHGTGSLCCDDGPAVWIAKQQHQCFRKTLPVCAKFVDVMTDPDVREDFVTGPCGHVMPFDEYFKVIGKL